MVHVRGLVKFLEFHWEEFKVQLGAVDGREVLKNSGISSLVLGSHKVHDQWLTY